MFCRHTAAMASRGVIVRSFFFVAPIATWSEIFIVVRATVFEGENMVNLVVIARPEFPLA